MNFCLGKLPARPGAVSLRFGDVFRASKLPVPPPAFGHSLSGGSWGMLANDRVGDCVLAGAAHETELWTNEATSGLSYAAFSDAGVLADYSAITGYNPADPSTDLGTDLQAAASYRQKIGVVDTTGKRHRITAYMALRLGDIGELALASYLMGAAGFGFLFPESAMDQFNANEPWDVVPGSKILGGHYVPITGRAANGNFICVTWNRDQEITPKFVETYNDESLAYFSIEMLNVTTKLSPEGFDMATLGEFLKEIAA